MKTDALTREPETDMFPDMPELATPGELALASGVNLNTLAYWRHCGTGPQYMKLGRCVRYRKSDVIRFFNDSLRTSTRDGEDE